MKKSTLITVVVICTLIIPFFLFGFADGPKVYHKHTNMTWLGVSTKSLTPQLRDYFGVDEEIGILISEVAEDSPAEKGGLKAGDVIIKADGDIIYNKSDLVEIIHDFDPGDEIHMEFVRNRDQKSITLKLGEAKIKKHHYFGYNPKRIEVIVPDMDIEIPDIEFEMPYIDEEELKELQREIKKEMKYHKEELREHMEELREQMKEIKIETKDELLETI
jgi:PDZ domain-containing secreted protein